MAVKHLIQGTRMALGLTHQYVNTVVLQIFPRKTNDNRIIVDEVCGCAHLRSSHYGENPLNAGHGKCSQPGCDCQKFSWHKHLFARRSRKAQG